MNIYVDGIISMASYWYTSFNCMFVYFSMWNSDKSHFNVMFSCKFITEENNISNVIIREICFIGSINNIDFDLFYCVSWHMICLECGINSIWECKKQKENKKKILHPNVLSISACLCYDLFSIQFNSIQIKRMPYVYTPLYHWYESFFLSIFFSPVENILKELIILKFCQGIKRMKKKNQIKEIFLFKSENPLE